VLPRGLQAADADVKQHYEEQIRLGEEPTRKIRRYESANADETEAPPVENPVEKDPKLKKLFDMKFMRDAEEHRQEDLEDLKPQLGGPKSGIVTMVGCDREPPQVPAEPSPGAQPSGKRIRRFVSANWFNPSGLPIKGCGPWPGPGVVESDGAERRREHLEQERAKAVSEALRERKDSWRPNVRLRDGVDPAVEKYSIPEVPKMYQTTKQLQAQPAFCMNPEVNSVGGFRRLIAPDIVTEPGKVIDPIGFRKKKEKDRIVAKNRARRRRERPNTPLPL
jgi:U3 small nucleolar RNA-associated protein 14